MSQENVSRGRFVEVHIVQNVPPSNLNRDQTGAPKTAYYGGKRRIRVSQQSWNKAVREYFAAEGLIPADMLAKRTKLVAEQIAQRLVEAGMEPDEALSAVVESFAKVDIKTEETGDDAGSTNIITYLGVREIESLAQAILEYREVLREVYEAKVELAQAKESEDKKAVKKAENRLSKGRTALGKGLPKDIGDAFHGDSMEIALFGRFMATKKRDKNIDGAVLRTDAISTHAAEIEFDYWVTMDDFQAETDQGAVGVGDAEFASACLYRTSVVDLHQLEQNLNHDPFAVQMAFQAYVRSFIDAFPTGMKHTRFAASPPALVLAVVRDSTPLSLAGAFDKPVRATYQKGLSEVSIEALDNYWGRLQRVTEGKGVRAAVCYQIEEVELKNLSEVEVRSKEALMQALDDAVFQGTTTEKEVTHEELAA